MKILMVAVFSSQSTNNSQANGFERAGYQVIRYNYRERAKEIGRNKRDDEIVDICKREEPVFVFFSKCDCVASRVLFECNRLTKTVLWFMDAMHNFNNGLREKIGFANYSFFALQEPYYEAKKHTQHAHFLYEGFDPDVNKPLEVPYKYDVSFIGNLRGKRKAFWDAFGFHVYTDVWGVDHSRAVCESKINLNFTDGGTSDRTYKVLASKGFLLTQPWRDMDQFFTVGEDLDIFKNSEDLRRKIKYYLSHKKERLDIAQTGYKTVQKFSRDNWAKEIIKICVD
jgi:spore maturation protein CgeB